MPELPEVQTIVNDLNKKIIGRRIVDVWFDAPKLIKHPKAPELKKQIKGLKISGVERRGKNILIRLSNDKLLLIHQKMTGHLLYGQWQIANGKAKSLVKGPLDEKVNNYIHVIFYLDNKDQLALSDLRKFAKIIFGARSFIENLSEIKKLGPDALTVSLDDFKKIISSQSRRKERLSDQFAPEKRKIKEVLMDQEKISGIGNIYADEILWKSGINPLRPANQLAIGEIKKLHNSAREILMKAIKLRGTSVSDYRDTSGKRGTYGDVRYVYRKEGKPCPQCEGSIKRIKIGSRSAYFCPKCQT